jgi:sucrose-6-phosphate hydrolase SacC (GH32 family)
MLELEPGQATSAGLAVRCSPDGSEQTLISYDWQAGSLVIDRGLSSLDPEVAHDLRITPYHPAAQTNLKLHIFVDRSVIEVFVNDELALASRVYPTRPDSLGVRLVASGGQARVKQVDAWKMKKSK